MARGQRNLLEQSERPEGPWIPSFSSRTEWADLAAPALRQEVRGDAQTPSMTAVVAGGAMAVDFGGRTVPGQQAWVDAAEERLELGPERLLLTALAAPDLHALADTVLQGVPHHAVAFGWRGGRVRLFLNAETALPTAVELTRAYPHDMFWALWGDVIRTTLYSLWTLEPGGRLYPRQWDERWGGWPYRQTLVDTLAFTGRPEAAALAIPDSVRALYEAFNAPTVEDAPFGSPNQPAVEPAPGVVVVPGWWHVALVRQPDGVVILEAPISSGYSARAMEEAARRFPGVPVKAVVTTSDAWPHVGGIREYVARGVPVYALDRNAPLLGRVVASSRTSHPDALARSPRPLDLHPVERAEQLGTGPNRIVLAPVRGESGERMMLAYLPEHRLLYASDLVQRRRDGTFWQPAYLLEVVRAVRREGWSVDRVFAMHLSPIPWSEIEAAAGPLGQR